MKRRLYSAVLLALILLAGSAEAAVQWNLHGSDKRLQLSFSGDALTAPVEIEKIFMRIDDIDYDLEGEPLSFREEQDGFTGVWKIGDRKATVSLVPAENRYRLFYCRN